MANPSKESCLLADSNDNPMISDQQSHVADVTITTDYTAPTPAQSVPVTSAAATDLDDAAAAIATLQTDVTNLATALASVLDILEAHGLSADA